MFAIVRGIRKSRNDGTGANTVLRLLVVLALVAALSLVGSAVAEYRVLHAVTRLPETGYEGVLSLECPHFPVGEKSGAGTLTSAENVERFAKPRLAGFWCAIPLTPD